MTTDQPRNPQPRALILRIYLDDAGTLRGRIDDPSNETWRLFVGGEQLLLLLLAMVGPDNLPFGLPHPKSSDFDTEQP